MDFTRVVSPNSPCTLITGIKYEEDVGERITENVHIFNTKNSADSNSNATIDGLPSQSGSHLYPARLSCSLVPSISTEGGR